MVGARGLGLKIEAVVVIVERDGVKMEASILEWEEV
jgi:hypothetical protein